MFNLYHYVRDLLLQRKQKEFINFAINFITKNGEEEFIKMMKNKIGIEFKLPISAIWRVSNTFFTQAQMQLTKLEQVHEFMAGRVHCELQMEKKNKIMDGYKSAIIANNMGSPTSAQHIKIDYVSLGGQDCRPTTGIPPEVDDTALGHEMYRAAPDEAYPNGSTLVIIKNLAADEANPINTTVASGTSQTVFNVQTGQGTNYQANDYIRVKTGAYEIVTVDSVDGDEITLKGTGLSVTPTSGMEVERGYGEVMLWCGDATSTPGSGTPVNHGDLRFFKNLVTSSMLECHVKYLTGG